MNTQLKETALELGTLAKVWFKKQPSKNQKIMVLGAIAAIVWTPIMVMT